MDNKIVSLELSDEQLESVVGGFGVNVGSFDGNFSHDGNGNFSHDGNQTNAANVSSTINKSLVAASAVDNQNAVIQTNVK